MGSLDKMIRRELVRAMLERTQSMNINKMMSMLGAERDVSYDDVEETLNVTYVNREEVPLALDIFRPKVSEKTELPVIVIIHGGGLFMGDRGLERPYSRFLAHRGYLVFSLEYRLAPKATVFQQFDDVCAGMDFVGAMLVDYDVDFSRIFMMADSAGAFLAAYVAAMHDSRKLQEVIGHKPSRMVFSAVGFITGMFYTQRVLEEQVFGDRRDDKEVLEFMYIENSEIVNNLPPAFLLTSCGDTFNNYSIRFNKVLKEAGRTSKLLYLGDEELLHIFPITNPEHPRSVEATDKMLAWFEEQADIRRESRKEGSTAAETHDKTEESAADAAEESTAAVCDDMLFTDPFVLLERMLYGDWKNRLKAGMEGIMENIPEGVANASMKHGNRLMSLPNGRKWIDHDFEE